MLHLAIVFLVVALIAALFGFGGVAALSFEGAKILFVIFLILAVLSFLGHGYGGRIPGGKGSATDSGSSAISFGHTQSQGGAPIVKNEAVAQLRSNGAKPVRVLMADPDESLRPVYRGPLFEEGFELVTAASGLECVARLRDRVPDVLVLEPQLPWGGGEGVLR